MEAKFYITIRDSKHKITQKGVLNHDPSNYEFHEFTDFKEALRFYRGYNNTKYNSCYVCFLEHSNNMVYEITNKFISLN